jgi:hypothetical protein
VWSSARPRRDNDVRYQFVVYTREAPAGAEAAAAGGKVRQVDMAGAPPILPPAVASQHDENQVGADKALTKRMDVLCCQCYQAVPLCVLGS